MPRISTTICHSACALATLLAAYPRFAAAATPTSYIGLDQGLWSNPANWSNGLPNSNAFDAIINNPAPITVQLNVPETINNLSLNSPDTLSLLSTLTLAGASLSNSGTMILNATASISALFLSTNATLSGGGSIALSSARCIIDGSGGVRLTTDNYIYGTGSIGLGVLKITNAGTISATTGALTLAPINATDGFINAGLLLASGGTLELNAGIYSNAGGLIEAQKASVVSIGASTIIGGTLTAQNGGTVALSGTVLSGTASNMSISGFMLLTGNTGSVLAGNFTNLGSLTFSAGQPAAFLFLGSNSLFVGPATAILNTGTIAIGTLSSAPITIQMNADTTFSGGGTITLFGNAFQSSVSFCRLTSDNVILGSGTLGSGTGFLTNSGSIIATTGVLQLQMISRNSIVGQPGTVNFNTGLIGAQGGTLSISATNSVTYINDGGTIEAFADSVIAIPGSVTVEGGAVGSQDGGTVTLGNATLINTTLSGQFLATSNPSLVGALSNSKELFIDGSSSSQLRFGLNLGTTVTFTNTGLIQLGPQAILINADTVFTGGGSLTFNDVSFSPGPLRRFTSDNLITASGTLGSLSIRFTNHGTVNVLSGSLLVQTAPGDGSVNTGNYQAEPGTSLTIAGGSIDNSSGSIFAYPSSFLMLNATILGGTVRADGNVIFNASSQIDTLGGSGSITVSPQTSLLSNGAVVGSLILNNAALHTIRPNGLTSGTSKVNSLALATDTSNAFSATLNLNDNKFILQSDPTFLGDKSAKASFLQSALLSGMHGGDWLGTGITSGTVAADQSAIGSHLTTLALYDNADLDLSIFGGQSVDSNSLLIATTLIAATNLDGTVDAADFQNWYTHILQANPFTEDGDFNHDGVVDGLDFDLWFAAAGAGAQPILNTLGLDPAVLSALRAPAPVPEPATAALLLTITPLLLKRRPKNRA